MFSYIKRKEKDTDIEPNDMSIIFVWYMFPSMFVIAKKSSLNKRKAELRVMNIHDESS